MLTKVNYTLSSMLSWSYILPAITYLVVIQFRSVDLFLLFLRKLIQFIRKIRFLTINTKHYFSTRPHIRFTSHKNLYNLHSTLKDLFSHFVRSVDSEVGKCLKGWFYLWTFCCCFHIIIENLLSCSTSIQHTYYTVARRIKLS